VFARQKNQIKMKHSSKFKLIAMMLLMSLFGLSSSSCSSDSNDDEYEDNTSHESGDARLSIDVKKAGTFSELIGDSRKFTTSDLVVSGYLNGSDIVCLRDMMMTTKGGRLERLDMSEASIVAGGKPYIYDVDGDFYTQDNTMSERMFEGCDAIRELILPNTVVRISHYLFGYSFRTNIRLITIGRSTVGSIDNDDNDVLGFLAWMDNLEEINVHERNLKFSSYDGCLYDKYYSVLYNVPPKYGQNTFNAPGNVKTIAGYAFRGCTFSSIKLSGSVQKLEDRAFAHSEIKSIDMGGVSDIGEDVFLSCVKLETVILSRSMTYIRDNTFRGCTSLDNVTIPASVKLIGLYAFHTCDNLHDIYIWRVQYRRQQLMT